MFGHKTKGKNNPIKGYIKINVDENQSIIPSWWLLPLITLCAIIFFVTAVILNYYFHFGISVQKMTKPKKNHP